ncbi:hypothetical protein NDU88_003103 [Pleurodeles waltl]|uniref:Uncharacterized protein n=1 Tax=Pleurodeles waltl TaxID=8319 RepID=A0AAV7WNF3_PLEWA|nr:hypothetical protein NDU88_003103 [Pleurodeles waltl]
MVEVRKAAGVGHWNRAALELHHTRQGTLRIPLRGNSGSTSKAASESREESGVAVRKSVRGAAAEAEVGSAGGALMDVLRRGKQGVGYRPLRRTVVKSLLPRKQQF